MVTLRDRRRQALRDEIINIAQELVAVKGHAAMSMDDLAAHAGISKPTLYAHFATKDDLVVEAATREILQLSAQVELLSIDQTPLEVLRVIMREILHRQMRMHALGIGTWPEVFNLLCSKPESRAAIEQVTAQIAAVVQAGIMAGEIDATLSPDAVLRAFFSLANAMNQHHVELLTISDPHQSAESLVAIFERGIRAQQ
jgi:AcrR family transcriptional regulator